MLTFFAKRAGLKRSAETLYAAIVAQSRLPAFYDHLGVPDTVAGRFEMIVVHMFLTLERLMHEGEVGSKLAQAVGEVFIGEMDNALRDMGVADVKVSKKMHATAGAYFGRLAAYREAASRDGERALEQALARNVFADAGEGALAAGRLAAYMRAAAEALGRQQFQSLALGQIEFPALDEAEAQP